MVMEQTTRYLIFEVVYEGDVFIGEAESLEAAAQNDDCNAVIVVEPDKPAYRLALEVSHEEKLEGQGFRVYWAWFNDEEQIVLADARYDDHYHYGEPVPEGYCRRFNGYEEVVMSNAEAAEIEQRERAARDSAESGQLYSVEYPNGAKVVRQRLDIIATGVMGIRGKWEL